VLRLEPAWVARDWLPPGRRLGLPDDAYEVGERGAICERWLASTTHADNRIGPPDEGLSYVVADDGEDRMRLDLLVQGARDLVLGADYAATHGGLGRLAKIYDYGARIPYHIHPRAQHASRVGRNPKDEAYYFPTDVDLGANPETFFGVNPWITQTRAHDVLLPYLVDWDSDAILQHSRVYLNVPGEGFHVPSGILHAPGTALTVEPQEESDCLSHFQALNAGRIISKELLFKDVSAQDREQYGERYLLEWVDWEANGDPYFYEHHHLNPQSIVATPEATVDWVYYNTTKFSRKRIRLRPGCRYTVRESGVYSALVWSGEGSIAGAQVVGRSPGRDELLVCHDIATRDHQYVSTGSTPLEVIIFFGPDLNPEAPTIQAFG